MDRNISKLEVQINFLCMCTFSRIVQGKWGANTGNNIGNWETTQKANSF